jgi:hypothetical protein
LHNDASSNALQLLSAKHVSHIQREFISPDKPNKLYGSTEMIPLSKQLVINAIGSWLCLQNKSHHLLQQDLHGCLRLLLLYLCRKRMAHFVGVLTPQTVELGGLSFR